MKFNETTLLTWFERDRCHVHLVDKVTEQKTIVEFWDDALRQAVEDGFISHRCFFRGKVWDKYKLHLDLYNYAFQFGFIVDENEYHYEKIVTDKEGFIRWLGSIPANKVVAKSGDWDFHPFIIWLALEHSITLVSMNDFEIKFLDHNGNVLWSEETPEWVIKMTNEYSCGTSGETLTVTEVFAFGNLDKRES